MLSQQPVAGQAHTLRWPRRLAVLLLSVGCVLSVGAHEGEEGPQDLPELPAFEIFGPGDLWTRLGRQPSLDVGIWIEYTIESDEMAPRRVRFSVVPQRDVPTPEHRVIEARADEPTGDRNYIKMLLTGIRDGARRLEAIQIKQDHTPVLTLPVGGEGAARVSADVSPGSNLKVENLGEVEVETPAGRFRCRRVRVSGQMEGETQLPDLYLWIDVEDRVPMWGIVKARQGEEKSILQGFGDGARSDLPPIHTYGP